MFSASGWDVQDKAGVNLSVSCGVAVREISFKRGEPDYTLFVDGRAIGTVEGSRSPGSRSNPRNTSTSPPPA